jgi:hypothetical protein
MQMAYSAMILSMVIAAILLSSSLVSYFTMGNEIVFASSDEGGDGGSDEGGDGGGEGDGNEEQDGGGNEEPSEIPADGEQEDGTDDQILPEDQQQQLQEGEQGEEVGQFVLCDESEVFIPETGECEEVETAQGQDAAPLGIPPTISASPLAGQPGGWGLPQGIAQGLDQGQGGSSVDGSSGIPRFAPSSSQGGGTTGTTQGIDQTQGGTDSSVPSFAPGTSQGSTPSTTQGSGPAQGASNDGTTQIPSFTPTGGGGGSQGGAPGTTTDTTLGSVGRGDDGNSGGTGGSSASQGGSPNTATSTGTSTTSTTTSTGTYTDPNGRFSIGYPPNAIVTPVDEESPGDKVVSFNSPPPSEFTTIGIEVADTGTPIDLDSHVNSYLVALETALPGYTLAESPDCLRYTLGGQKACAYIYTLDAASAADGASAPAGQSSSSLGSSSAVMELFSVVGNNLYKISYTTIPSEFNGQLPVAEGMIRSFVLLNSDVS